MRWSSWSLLLLLAVPALGNETQFYPGAGILEVHVPVEGLLRFMGHGHVISATDLNSTLTWDADGKVPQHFDLRVPVDSLRVMDEKVDDEEREKVRDTMLSKAVLNLADFKNVHFSTTSIEVQNDKLWALHGQLTIRGMQVPVEVYAGIDIYPDQRIRARGAVDLRLPDFGINPVTAVGGMIRTGDTVEVRFDFIGNLPQLAASKDQKQ